MRSFWLAPFLIFFSLKSSVIDASIYRSTDVRAREYLRRRASALDEFLSPSDSILVISSPKSTSQKGDDEISSPASKYLRSTASANKCVANKSAPFAAQLEFEFTYSVQFEIPISGSVSPKDSLFGLESALVSAVSSRLTDCDDQGEPMYQVIAVNEDDVKHRLSIDEFCASPAERKLCQVVIGTVNILLDRLNDTMLYDIEDALTMALDDTDFLRKFTSEPIFKASYLERQGNELRVILPGDQSLNSDSGPSATTFVSIAAASVSFLMGSIFCYGMARRRFQSNHPEPSVRHRSRLTRRSSPTFRNTLGSQHAYPRLSPSGLSLGSGNRNVKFSQKFIRLQNDGGETPAATHGDDPRIVVPLNNMDSHASPTAWSISDITSGSGSFHSGSSSESDDRLESIEEERSEDVSMSSSRDHFYNDLNSPLSRATRASTSSSFFGIPAPRDVFFEHFSENPFNSVHENSEISSSMLEGCQFIDDSLEDVLDAIRSTEIALDEEESRTNETESTDDIESRFTGRKAVDGTETSPTTALPADGSTNLSYADSGPFVSTPSPTRTLFQESNQATLDAQTQTPGNESARSGNPDDSFESNSGWSDQSSSLADETDDSAQLEMLCEQLSPGFRIIAPSGSNDATMLDQTSSESIIRNEDEESRSKGVGQLTDKNLGACETEGESESDDFDEGNQNVPEEATNADRADHHTDVSNSKDFELGQIEMHRCDSPNVPRRLRAQGNANDETPVAAEDENLERSSMSPQDSYSNGSEDSLRISLSTEES